MLGNMRERLSLAAAAKGSIDPDKLFIGMYVRAWAENEKRFWTAVVTDFRVEEEECQVTVRYTGPGTGDDEPATLSISKLKPYDEIVLVEGKRTRRAPDFTYATPKDEGERGEESHHADDAPPRDATAATGSQKRKRDSKTSKTKGSATGGSDVVKQIVDSRTVGYRTDYLTVFEDNATKWLSADRFYDEDNTVTAALLAYTQPAARIVQTYRRGQELLVAFRQKGSGHWARIPASAYSSAHLATLRENPTVVTEWELQAGIDRIFHATTKAIRAGDHTHLELGFPTYLAAAILKGKGTPVRPSQHDQRHYGDQNLVRFTRAELQQVFGAYDFEPEWDMVFTARAASLGQVDWAQDHGVCMRWYARESRQPNYAEAAGNPGTVKKLPLKWIEILEVRVHPKLSTLEDDERLAAL